MEAVQAGLGPLLPSNGPERKLEAVQVATLLTVIGEEAREVFSTFSDWAAEGDDAKIAPVIDKFEQYCLPRKNIPFERYCFYRRTQEPGETYDQYRTALMKIAENCDFDTITPREILRDRLVFGIRDAKTRERLLREAGLTLQRTDKICHAAESMLVQMKVVGESSTGASVSAIHSDKDKTKHPESHDMSQGRECWNCGRRHDLQKRELCPAYGKTCNKCHKINHFAVKCRSGGSPPSVHPVSSLEGQGDPEEVFQTHTQS